MREPEGGQGADVVPFTGGTKTPAPDVSDGSVWSLAQAALHNQNASLYGAWFESLKQTGVVDGCVMLEAPSKFHADYVKTHFYDMVLSTLRDCDRSVISLALGVA